MVVKIPAHYSSRFAQFFDQFDQDLEWLKIRSYGISISTLEEVFLNIGKLDDPNTRKRKKIIDDTVPHWERKQQKNQKSFNLKDNHSELDRSFLTNFTAVLIMRINSYKRNKKAFLNEVLIPALIIIFGISLTKIPRVYETKSRVLEPSWLPQN